MRACTHCMHRHFLLPEKEILYETFNLILRHTWKGQLLYTVHMTIYECRTWDIETATLYVTMVIQYRKYVVEFVGLHKIHVLNKLLACILGIEPLPCLSCVHETQYWA